MRFGRTNARYVVDIQQAETREEQRRAVAASTQYGNWTGLDLGVHYEQAGAFVPDDSVVPTSDRPVIDYFPAKPGHRAPHLWLRQGTQRISSIELYEREFVLLTGNDGRDWSVAAATIARHNSLPLKVIRIGREGDFVTEDVSFTDLYGIEQDGAVLVRPDGHVAFRAPSLPVDPVNVLQAALVRTLGYSPHQLPHHRPGANAVIA